MIRPVALALLLAPAAALAQDRLIIQSTTSTQASGLYDHLWPLLEADTGLSPQVVAVGTGQALQNARACDGDVLIVHARAAEEAFIAEGYGIARHDLMANDFIIVGPAADPAGVAGAPDLSAALAALTTGSFLSRGDDSGTHKAELSLWAGAGVAAEGDWRIESGQGMGATLNMAVALGAYTMTDRATWIAFGNKGSHRIVAEGAPELLNPYGLIVVSPEACPDTNLGDAEMLRDWLLSPAGKAAINGFVVDGHQLFFAAP